MLAWLCLLGWLLLFTVVTIVLGACQDWSNGWTSSWTSLPSKPTNWIATNIFIVAIWIISIILKVAIWGWL
jgi:hypothetical protein